MDGGGRAKQDASAEKTFIHEHFPQSGIHALSI